jgi:hypothetical protein
VHGVKERARGNALGVEGRGGDLALDDGARAVGEIMERAFLSDFEVLKGTVDLLERHLIERGAAVKAAEPAPAAVRRRRGPRPPRPRVGVLAALAAGAVYLIRETPRTRLPRPGPRRGGLGAAQGGLAEPRVSIERAVRVYYDASGRYTRSLEDLVVAGILEEDALRIPTAASTATSSAPRTEVRPLRPQRLGQIDLDLSLERSLAPVAGVRPARPATRRNRRASSSSNSPPSAGGLSPVRS